MGYAQDLLDEIEFEEYHGQKAIRAEEIEVVVDMNMTKKFKDALEVEKEMEAELHTAIEQELSGNLSPDCAQALIDSIDSKIQYT